MKERDEKRSGSGSAIFGGLLVLVFLPVLYVLSLGPAALIVAGQPFPPKSLNRFYQPLGVLAQNCEPAEKALTWYMELWTGRTP